jgi:hypothetical protein
MISDAVRNSFMKKLKRGWNPWHRMYWAIDLHDAIIPGTYTLNNEGKYPFPYAVEVLQWLTNRKDMAIILFTSGHFDPTLNIMKWLSKEHGISFDFVNENPECPDNDLCCFEGKFYMDVLLDDKAGFIGETDWLVIKNTLIEIGEWDKKISHEQNN